MQDLSDESSVDEYDFEGEELDKDDDEHSESNEESGDEEAELDQQETIVERGIEGDFDRLIGSIRSDDASGSSMLTRIWDKPLIEGIEDADFLEDLRGASGIGRLGKHKKNSKGKGRRNRRLGPVLSHEVKSLIGTGNQAYVDGDTQGAIRTMQEVIRIEPRASSAWSVLAACYRDLDEPLKALQLSIIGAHLTHDAEEWDQLAIQSRDLGYHQQALYCFRKVYSLDPTNVNALWERATLATEMGDFRTARHAYLAILKLYPHDVHVLNSLRPILVEQSELTMCTSLFAQAFQYYAEKYPTGKVITPDGRVVLGGGFGHLEIYVLADLYNATGLYDEAIKTIRFGCRWLQGRIEQRFWDICTDDREYDVEGFARESHSTIGNLEAGGHPLDVNARHRIALARLKLGEIAEGKMHADIVLSQSALEYSPLFSEIADTYFELSMFAEARSIYEVLGADATTSSVHVLLQVAACRRNLGELKDAAEVYDHVIEVDPTNNDAKMKLAEIYEVMNEPRKALDLVYQVIDARRKRGAGAQDGSSTSIPHGGSTSNTLFEEGTRPTQHKSKPSKTPNRLSKVQLRDLEEKRQQEAIQGHRRLLALWEQTLNHEEHAEQEWLLEAEKLVEMFRETRTLFVTSTTYAFRGLHRSNNRPRADGETEEEIMASRLHLDIQQDAGVRKTKVESKGQKITAFRGITFTEWMLLFVQYAFLLTERDNYPLAEEVLRHALVSVVFQSRKSQDTLRLALITCAIRQSNLKVVIEQSRKLISAYQFNNEPLRLLLASLASGLRATDVFITSTLQKQLIREIKLSDAAVKGKNIVWVPTNRRYAPPHGSKATDEVEEGAESEEDEILEDLQERFAIPEKPTKDNPAIVAVYGMACNAVKSYQSALFYLLHAYDYCGVDPMICLALCVASMGRAMQRQADNRNYLITQAMGFLSQYRSLRGAGDESKYADEIEFNYGRAFHQLGLLSHAVRHYESCLGIVERRQETEPAYFGVAREAAYNLSLILVTTGATSYSHDLYRRWLTI